MKNRMAATLMATITALKRALSRTPMTSSTMMSRTMITAGRLMMAPGEFADGAAVIHIGSCDADAGEEPLHVAAPADRHGHRADRVLEDQVPADHPRDDLAERRVGVGVGAAGDRHHRRELGVAERGERAREAGGQVATA